MIENVAPVRVARFFKFQFYSMQIKIIESTVTNWQAAKWNSLPHEQVIENIARVRVAKLG